MSGMISSSSSQLFGVFFLLSGICFSHTDDADGVAALGPGDKHHPRVDKSNGNQSLFTVILAIVRDGEVFPLEDLCRSRHIQTTLCESHDALIGIEFDLHFIIVTTKIILCLLYCI